MSCKIIFVRNFSKLKIAIVYSTLGGTTRECAELLSRELKNQSVSLFEIGKEEPNASEFDVVVVPLAAHFNQVRMRRPPFAQSANFIATATSLCSNFICR